MAQQNSGIQTQVPKLVGTNYFHWQVQMKVLLESQDLWGIVETELRELPENATEAVINEHRENTRKDKRALHILYQACNEAVFERIMTSSTSEEAWDTLHKAYRGEQRVQRVKLQTLICEFDSCRMNESETVESYFNRITMIVNQLRMNEEKIEDQRVVEKILRSVTRKYESVVVAVEEYKDMTTMSITHGHTSIP